MPKKNNPGQQQPKLLGGKSLFSKSSLVVYAVIFGVIGGYILLKSFAASPTPPTIYLSPASQTLPINTTFTVQVRENSGATAVNGVQANFSYNAALVDFVNTDITGTGFNVGPTNNGGSGVVSIARARCGGVPTDPACNLPSGSVTGDQLVATVTFKTKTTGGPANMVFTTGTALVSYNTNLDILGSLAATAGGTYTIDTTPPTVTITAPTNGTTIALGSTTNIAVSAVDASSTISKVDIYIDGALKTTLTASPPYNYSWNTTGLSLGSHTIQAKSTDSGGNLGSSSTFTVTIADQTAPSAPTNLRLNGSTTTSITLAWNASADNVAATGYRIKRGVTTLTTTALLTYTDTGLTAGTSYTYTVEALDNAGNVSPAATLTATAQTQTIVPGDITGDGKVDIFDLTRLSIHYGATPTSGNWDAASDLNNNGVVDIFDLTKLSINWAP